MTMFLSLLGRFWPHIISAVIGATAAWAIQGIRLDMAEAETAVVQQAFDTYRLEQKRLAYEAAEKARELREQSERDWRTKYAQLKKDQDVFKRCVAAGKCGALRVSHLPGETAGAKPGLSPGIRLDAHGANAVPVAGEPAAAVLNDCAETTLMLNELQRGIESQEGY